LQKEIIKTSEHGKPPKKKNQGGNAWKSEPANVALSTTFPGAFRGGKKNRGKAMHQRKPTLFTWGGKRQKQCEGWLAPDGCTQNMMNECGTSWDEKGKKLVGKNKTDRMVFRKVKLSVSGTQKESHEKGNNSHKKKGDTKEIWP